MGKFFNDIYLAPANEPNTVVFKRTAQPLTDDVLELAEKIRSALSRIRSIKLDQEERQNLLEQLRELAKTGLGGDNPQPAEGAQLFEGFKRDVEQVGARVREKYLSTLYQIGVAWLVAGVVLGGALWFFSGDIRGWLISDAQASQNLNAQVIENTSTLLVAFLLSLFGVGIGWIVAESIRNRNITYDNFDVIYRYKFSPIRHCLFITFICAALQILLFFDVFQIGVGSLLLNDVKTNPSIGIIIGFVCAVAEPVVSSLIEQTKPVQQSENGSII